MAFPTLVIIEKGQAHTEFGWIVFESSNMMFLIKSISVTYQTLIIMEDIFELYFGSF